MFFKIIKYLFIIMILAFAGSMLNSCKDEPVTPVFPTIKIEIGNGYISSDTILDIDEKVKVKITAFSEESAITLFNFKIYNGKNVVSIDSGLNSTSFSTVISLSKGFSTQERWVFSIRNKDMNWDSVSMVITLNSNAKFGEIVHLSGIELGAQNNNGFGSFYSLSQKRSFNFDSAYFFQKDIDFCYYYDISGDLNTLASPAANIDASIYSGTYNLSVWTIKNEYRFVQTSLSIADFNKSNNDSLIIANSFVYQSGKRKCKQLIPGNIYSFASSEKKGLLKINDVIGSNTGKLAMEIKFQKN